MYFAFRNQKFQDWFTQQWVIIWGRKIDPNEYDWLIGPFGELDGIGEDFIYQLAEKEELILKRNSSSVGLLRSVSNLNLPEDDICNLSKKVIDFYEKTADYELQLNVKWNPFFKFFGYLVNKLFSQRINQLNIPTRNFGQSEKLTNEIIQLVSKDNSEVRYTIWLRKLKERVIYSGIYTTCTLPSDRTCIKAIFPLPKGNATVILNPRVGANNELILNSSGRQFGDPGFYFQLNDADGNHWSQYIRSFTENLIVSEVKDQLEAHQILKLWNLQVAKFEYRLMK